MNAKSRDHSRMVFAINQDKARMMNRTNARVAICCLLVMNLGILADRGLADTWEALKIETPDTPRLRFLVTDDMDTPLRTWDGSINENGFILRDVTAGKDVIVTPNQGGTTAPYIPGGSYQASVGSGGTTAALTVTKPAEAGIAELIARFEVADASGALNIRNATTTDGYFIPKIQGTQSTANAALIMEGLIADDTGGNPALVINASLSAGGSLVTRPLVVFRNNNAAKATIAANGHVYATSFNTVSSRALKRQIVDLDAQTATTAVDQLTPVQFIYNDDPAARLRIGFIAEDVPDIVASSDRKSVPLMDTVALVTRVVKDHQQAVLHHDATLQRQGKVLDSQGETARQLEQSLSVTTADIEREAESISSQAKSIEQLRQRLKLLEQ